MYVNLIRVAYDGLVAQPLTGGRSSLSVVPDLAARAPEPSDGGRTYVFEIRPGIRYSTGAVVQPSDFVRGIERALRPDSGVGERSRDHRSRHLHDRPIRRRVICTLVSSRMIGTDGSPSTSPNPTPSSSTS